MQVLRILRSETMCTLFVKFCEENLCEESAYFLVDVINYEGSTAGAEEQFEELTSIVHTYLTEGSPQEVNVSSAYQKTAQAWLQNEERFMALEDWERRRVLTKQRNEIVKVRLSALFVFLARSLSHRIAKSEGRETNADLLCSGGDIVQCQAHVSTCVRSSDRAVAEETGRVVAVGEGYQ